LQIVPNCGNSRSNLTNGPGETDQKPRCPDRRCGKRFTRQSDLNRHMKEQHNPNLNSFLCGCCEDKQQERSFKRMEKLLDHKVKVHGHMRGSEIKSCPETACQQEFPTRQLLFCTAEGLRQHLAHVHGTPPPEQSTREKRATRWKGSTCSCKSVKAFLKWLLLI